MGKIDLPIKSSFVVSFIYILAIGGSAGAILAAILLLIITADAWMKKALTKFLALEFVFGIIFACQEMLVQLLGIAKVFVYFDDVHFTTFIAKALTLVYDICFAVMAYRSFHQSVDTMGVVDGIVASATSENVSQGLYCPQCGSKLTADAKFCGKCGHALK